MNRQRRPRQPYYGIAEIAEALGISRQLVAAWRRRGSHGIPEPDAELASGPLWTGATIEPWIDSLPLRPSPNTQLSSTVVDRTTRRALRLLALLFEERPRAALVVRGCQQLAELAPALAEGGPVRLRTLLVRPVALAADSPVSQGDTTPEQLAALREQLLGVLPDLLTQLHQGEHCQSTAVGDGA